jgi:twitching motility protein PilT
MSDDTGLIDVAGQGTNGSESTPAARAQPPGGHPTPLDVNTYLKALLDLGEGGVSDLHFKVGMPPLLRLRGQLESSPFPPLTEEDTRSMAMALAKPDVREHIDTVRDYDTAYAIPGAGRFRVNIFRQRETFAIVLRVICADIPTVEQLRLPPILNTIAMEERGLVLVTGATGSGKSSTLAAMMGHVNANRKAHILTIEDPIEYVHADNQCEINQREVGSDSDSFAKALRAALRQDPDIILVGEMRDAETISIAIKAAETGHLVFSTLHTVDAPKTINRIIDTFPAEQQRQVRLQLSANLKAVISQRLLPSLDGGRIPALEIMRWTTTIEDCILNPEKTAMMKDAIAAGFDQYGMQTFDQHLMQLHQQQQVSLEIAMAAASSPSDFQRALTFE